MPQWHRSTDSQRNPELTEVTLTFIAGKIEQVCLFGRPVGEKVIDDTNKRLYFASGAIFGLARWTATSYGAMLSRLDILRAVPSGQSYVALPFVRPGAEALLRLDGSAKVQQVLLIIENITAAGIDPADAAPDYWLHVGNRLAADQRPRPYTRARHAVWKLRQRFTP